MKTKSLFAGILFLFAFSLRSFGQDGEQIFKSTCGACHTIGKGKLTGPDLKDVASRHPEEWILKWVKSSQTLVKGGDESAMILFKNNNNIVMPDQSLNEAEIKSVLGYIKTRGEAVAKEKEAAAQATANATPASAQGGGGKENESLLHMFSFSEYIMFILIGMMLIVIWGMSMSIKTLTAQLKEKSHA